MMFECLQKAAVRLTLASSVDNGDLVVCKVLCSQGAEMCTGEAVCTLAFVLVLLVDKSHETSS